MIVDDLVQSGGTLLECQVRADGVLQSGFSKIIWTFADILRSLRDFSRKEVRLEMKNKRFFYNILFPVRSLFLFHMKIDS